MKWTQLLMTVALVLGMESIVSADFAWVLWEKQMTLQKFEFQRVRTATDWAMVTAHQTKNECEEEKPGAWNKMRNRFTEKGLISRIESAAPQGLTLYLGSGRTDIGHQIEGRTELLLLCFPDTVDPREKK